MSSVHFSQQKFLKKQVRDIAKSRHQLQQQQGHCEGSLREAGDEWMLYKKGQEYIPSNELRFLVSSAWLTFLVHISSQRS